MTCLNDTVSLARVNELLTYSPETGEFRWRVRRNQHADVGQLAGTLNTKNYRVIKIDGRFHKAHRLAYLIVHQAWPPAQIDHVDGDRSNNRIANLREATPTENSQNRKTQANNASGYPGVCFHTRLQKYQAYIHVDRKRTHLGYFDTLKEAIAARQAAEILYFKEFRRI